MSPTAPARHLWPFGVAAVAALAALALPPGETHPGDVLAAVVLTLAIAVAMVVVPARRPPGWREAAAPLAYFGVVGLLRDAEGGATSGYGPLVLLPVFWLALYGSREHLLASFAGVALTFVVPLLAYGDPEYPTSEWRRALLWLIVAPVVGLTTQRMVQQVRETARTDVLTGLRNRRGWNDAIDAALARSRRSGQPVSLALLDIDRFKAYNDRWGHGRGDVLLAEAAAAWRAVVREVDVLARWGGEEFAVLLPEADAAEALAIVDRLRRATPGGITCSAGLAQWDGREGADDLVQRADRALYDAKDAGRDRTVVAPHGRRRDAAAGSGGWRRRR